MTDTLAVRTRPIDPEQLADIEKFEQMLVRYLAGDLEEDVFRVFRLGNGIYGQRQGGQNQMVRVKVPYGSIDARAARDDRVARRRVLARLGPHHHPPEHPVPLRAADEDPRGHATPRVGGAHDAARRAATRSATSRACHLAGACPHEVLDISPWAEAAFRHFVRNPLGQRLPRKFKINFSGCATDCGQAMFNDVGVIATTRTNDDGDVESGFRVFIAGGLGANPHPALALEDFTSREDLLPTIEALLRVFDQTGNRENKLRARMKWVVDTLGFDELKRRVLATRKMLPASSTWPGGIPDVVEQLGDAARRTRVRRRCRPSMGQGTPVTLKARDPQARWDQANVVRGIANGRVSAYAYAALGDITGDQFRALASIQRELGADVRLTNRQNVVFRNLTEAQLPVLYERLQVIGMAEPGAELARDVVACPGADTCNLAVTQSRGLAKAIGDLLEEEGLADVGGLRINISGCTNSCGQHHAVDIGFFGAERRAHDQAAPGYQMLLGGYVGQEQIHFGDKALRLPAKTAPVAAVRVVRRFAEERQAGETFRGWLDRSGGAQVLAVGLADLDEFPLPAEGPEFYVDYGETGPYVKEIGESECAT